MAAVVLSQNPTRRTVHRVPSAAVRQRRATAVLLVLVVCLFGVGSLADAGQVKPAPFSSRGGMVPIASTFHDVQPGDTLWVLARRAQPQGDVRPLVAQLLAEHGRGPLIPGETIRLPL